MYCNIQGIDDAIENLKREYHHHHHNQIRSLSKRHAHGGGRWQPYSGPLNTTPYPGCPAALKCVPRTLCTAQGVLTNTPVYLTREQEDNRVPVTDCENPETNVIGICCRDPNYKDPWPGGMMMAKTHPGFDNGQYHPHQHVQSVTYQQPTAVQQAPAYSHGAGTYQQAPTYTNAVQPAQGYSYERPHQPVLAQATAIQRAPAYSHGAVAYQPAPAQTTAVQRAPAYSQGAVAYQPAPAQTTAVQRAPAYSQGAVAYQPAPAQPTAVQRAPAYSQGAVAYQPAPAQPTAVQRAPAYSQGAVAYQPAPAVQRAPAYSQGAVAYQPAPAVQRAPAYSQGAVAYQPAPAVQRAPAYSQGAVAYQPAPAQTRAVQRAPAYSHGASAYQPVPVQPQNSAPRQSYRGQAHTSAPAHRYTGPLNTTPYPGCAAALKCVSILYCNAQGVMTNTPVYLTRDQENDRAPLTDCTDLGTNEIGKCCRDPNYKDPWPGGMMMANTVHTCCG